MKTLKLNYEEVYAITWLLKEIDLLELNWDGHVCLIEKSKVFKNEQIHFFISRDNLIHLQRIKNRLLKSKKSSKIKL